MGEAAFGVRYYLTAPSCAVFATVLCCRGGTVQKQASCPFPMGVITFVNGCINNYSLLSILLLSIFTIVNITFVNIHFCDITFVM